MAQCVGYALDALCSLVLGANIQMMPPDPPSTVEVKNNNQLETGESKAGGG
jgi:hypothetical protein